MDPKPPPAKNYDPDHEEEDDDNDDDEEEQEAEADDGLSDSDSYNEKAVKPKSRTGAPQVKNKKRAKYSSTTAARVPQKRKYAVQKPPKRQKLNESAPSDDRSASDDIEYDDWWTAEDEQRPQQSWSQAYQQTLESISANEVAAWRRSNARFGMVPPDLLPASMAVENYHNERDQEIITWSGASSQELCNLLCCPAFDKGRAAFFKYCLDVAIARRLGTEPPDVSLAASKRNEKFVELIKTKAEIEDMELPSELLELIQGVTDEFFGEDLPEHIAFLDELEEVVANTKAPRGSIKVKSPEGVTTGDFEAVCKAWDIYAKAAKLPDIATEMKDYPNPRGPTKRGQPSHKEDSMELKKQWILKQRRETLRRENLRAASILFENPPSPGCHRSEEPRHEELDSSAEIITGSKAKTPNLYDENSSSEEKGNWNLEATEGVTESPVEAEIATQIPVTETNLLGLGHEVPLHAQRTRTELERTYGLESDATEDYSGVLEHENDQVPEEREGSSGPRHKSRPNVQKSQPESSRPVIAKTPIGQPSRARKLNGVEGSSKACSSRKVASPGRRLPFRNAIFLDDPVNDVRLDWRKDWPQTVFGEDLGQQTTGLFDFNRRPGVIGRISIDHEVIDEVEDGFLQIHEWFGNDEWIAAREAGKPPESGPLPRGRNVPERQ